MFAKIQFASTASKENILLAIKNCIVGTFDVSATIVEHVATGSGWSVVEESATHVVARTPCADRPGYHYVHLYIQTSSLLMSYGDDYVLGSLFLTHKGVIQNASYRVLGIGATAAANLMVSITPNRFVINVPDATPGNRCFFGVYVGESNLSTYGPSGARPVVLFGNLESYLLQVPQQYSILSWNSGTPVTYQHGHASFSNRMMSPNGQYYLYEAGYASTNSAASLKVPAYTLKYLALPVFEDVEVFGAVYACAQDKNNVTFCYLLPKE